MNIHFNWRGTSILKVRSVLFSDAQCCFHWLLYLLLAVLGIQSFFLVNDIASNVVFADAWRHLELYYVKWVDGTFRLADLFSDHHSTALSAIIFILNGELFSLQFKYQAFNAMAFKLLLGVFVIHYMIVLIRDVRLDLSSNILVYLTAVYLLLLFYGLNTIGEYTWYLIAESHVMYLFQFLFLMYCDRFMRDDGNVLRRLLPVGIFTLVLYLASVTALKLTVASVIFALFPILFFSKSHRKDGVILIGGLVLIYLTLSILINSMLDTTPYPYELSFDKLIILLQNPYKVILSVVGGVTAGFVNSVLIKSLTAIDNGIYMTVLIMVIFSFVSISYFVYFRHKMWQISFVPLFLAVYLIAFVMSVIVFRIDLSVEISLFKSWPLFIIRYITAYHIGILGVLLIYIMYFSRFKPKPVYIYCFAIFLTTGILHQIYCLYATWRDVPSIMASQRKVERDMCSYKDNRDIKLHPAITRGNFTQENYDYLVENRLNIFAENGPGVRCSIEK